MAGAYSRKSGFQIITMTATHYMDFTATTGTQEGELVYMWVQMPALSQLDTLANEGLAIVLGSSTSNCRKWVE